MRIWEIITRVDEMAFGPRAIVDKLRALQPQIISHALKIIAYRTATRLRIESASLARGVMI